MKRLPFIAVLLCLFLLAGCDESNMNDPLQSGEDSTTIAFVSGMGCNDPSCTDVSHHHDCPVDCTDYSHYHNCALDCTETSHHHTETHHDDSHQTSPVTAVSTSFVSGMGCNDLDCTDASHHHDCPADCTDYSHYHNCSLDCDETSHHHETDNHHSGSQHH